METLVLAICVAAFLGFGVMLAGADYYTRDVRETWKPKSPQP
jgi:hypothetical protein